MLPIRFASVSLTCRLCAWLLPLLLGGLLLVPAQAVPLAALGVDEFRALIDPKHDPSPDPEALTNYRGRLRKAAADLPSLAEVSRVLLMSEWSASEFDLESKVSLNQVKKAVRQSGETEFKRDVQKLLAQDPDDPNGVGRAIVAEIKRDVRLQLLERLEQRTRFYLREGRAADRIAAANLLSETITTSRRQDISQYSGVIGVMISTSKDVTPSARYLRDRLRELTGEVRRLTGDAEPQVQVAAVRALSNLERNSVDLVATLKPLLTSEQTNVVTRRATAEALGHMLEVNTMQMDKSRPQPFLEGVEQVLPVAVLGLADSDSEVRLASLETCQRAALILDDLASDKLAMERRPVFRPAMAAVDRALPAINRVARDRVPELRVIACHVLETMVLAAQKIRHVHEQPLPPPLPEPSQSPALPGKEGDKNKGVSLPSSRNGRHASTSRPSQWAAGSGEARRSLPLPPPVPRGDDAAMPAVTLERPVKLPSQPRPASSEVRPAAFVARQIDELPPPAPVNAGLQGTLKTMIADLSDPDYRVRLAAVDVLETLGERAEPAIPALVNALGDHNKFVRWASARTLGRLSPRRPSEVVPGVARLLNDREDPSVRITAAYALEQYGPDAKAAVPHLAHVINRGDKDYIIAILHTIQGIGTDAAPALPNVAWVLRDRAQPTSVRVEAAQTLGRFGALAKDQLPTLRDLMVNDPNEAVRNAASTAVLGVDRPRK